MRAKKGERRRYPPPARLDSVKIFWLLLPGISLLFFFFNNLRSTITKFRKREMQDTFFGKAKQSVTAMKDKISDLSEDIWGDEQKQLIEDWKEGGVNKVKETLESIGGSSAIFLRSGFELKSVNINLGIPPVITSTFNFLNDINDEERTALLEEIKESRIIHLLVNCLLKARDFFEKVKVGEYKMASVNITIGLTPGINVTFQRIP